MPASDPLLGRQISFGIAGVIIGFLLGFVVSHEVQGGRNASRASAQAAAPAPARGGGGMAGAGGAIPDGPAAPGGAGMDQVTQELNSLRAVIKDDPGNVQALSRLGKLYMDASMYDQALGYLESAYKAAPDNLEVRTDRATALLMTGKSQEAVDEFRACLEREPGQPRIWYSLGFAYVQVAEYDKAEQAFGKALELSPGAFDMEALKAEIERLKAQRPSRPGGAPS